MLKLPITFKNLDDEEETETFYFNLWESELVELEAEFKGGMKGLLEYLIDTNDESRIIQIFKRIVLLAYGQKSEDGKRFVKTEAMREDFQHHPAYNKLFMNLATDTEYAVMFLKGTFPSDLSKYIDEAMDSPANPTRTGDRTNPPPPPR